MVHLIEDLEDASDESHITTIQSGKKIIPGWVEGSFGMVNGTNEEILKEIFVDEYLTDNEHSLLDDLEIENRLHQLYERDIGIKRYLGRGDVRTP